MDDSRKFSITPIAPSAAVEGTSITPSGGTREETAESLIRRLAKAFSIGRGGREPANRQKPSMGRGRMVKSKTRSGWTKPTGRALASRRHKGKRGRKKRTGGRSR